MKSRLYKVELSAIVLILFGVPVVVTQATPNHGRSLEGVRLADTIYEEVLFRNEAQDLDLAGMLFLPDKRDSELSEGDWFVLALVHF